MWWILLMAGQQSLHRCVVDALDSHRSVPAHGSLDLWYARGIVVPPVEDPYVVVRDPPF